LCTRRRTDVGALRVRALVQSRTDIALGTANARTHRLAVVETNNMRYERHYAEDRWNDCNSVVFCLPFQIFSTSPRLYAPQAKLTGVGGELDLCIRQQSDGQLDQIHASEPLLSNFASQSHQIQDPTPP
jgi:hypothetical protein